MQSLLVSWLTENPAAVAPGLVKSFVSSSLACCHTAMLCAQCLSAHTQCGGLNPSASQRSKGIRSGGGGGAASLGLCGLLAATWRPAGLHSRAALPARCADVSFCLPHSLLERKEQWRRQMEEQLRSRPDPDTPPGHTMMPEGQRLEMLSNLKQSKRKRTEDSGSKIARIRESEV